MTINPPADQLPLLARLFWTAVLALHGTAAVIWWWIMPGGFPLAHPRFWANRVAPVIVLLFVAAAVAARGRKRADVFAGLMLGVPAAWLMAAISTLVTFPLSRPLVPIAVALGAMVMIAGWWLTLRRHGGSRTAYRWCVPLMLVAALAGLALPRTQRAAPPSTHPLAEALAADGMFTGSPPDFAGARAVRFDESLMVQPNDGLVTARVGRVMMTVQPLLTFISRSPDGFWTIFARRADRRGPPRTWVARRHDAAGITLGYRDDPRSLLRVEPGDGAVAIEATSELPEPVYSHLNTYCEIGLYGHKALSVSFSPCPDERIEITYSQYPIGRPQRCAYLDAAGTFHVVEARSGEKGPFRPLASGPLVRGEPLAMTLYDGDEPLCRITLDDWSGQASTDLSPTAGWGLPVNAIEFSRYGEAPSSPVGISITLAGTSVGRGWDSVGHSRGTYRNRMRVETLLPTGAEPANE